MERLTVEPERDLVDSPDVETCSDGYARRFSGEVGSWFLKVQAEATLRMLAPFSASTVLDVGGGHGQLTGALVENGYQVTVFGSESICQKRISQYIANGSCSFRAGSLLELPYPDHAFDIVISYRLLPHVREWKRLLGELARVSRHVVLIDYPTLKSFNFLTPFLFRVKKHFEGNTRNYILFRESHLQEVLTAHDFALTDAILNSYCPWSCIGCSSATSSPQRRRRGFDAWDLLGGSGLL